MQSVRITSKLFDSFSAKQVNAVSGQLARIHLQALGFEKVGRFVLASAHCAKIKPEHTQPELSYGGWVYAWATKDEVKYVGQTSQSNLFDRFKRDREGCYRPNRSKLLSHVIDELQRADELDVWAISDEKIRQKTPYSNLRRFESRLISELSPEWSKR